uniref:Uncharacterized protein n=1 Tax=Oryza sativa subsp. japonica TaxID=39947 RepID=Q2QU59_ORYSJ|nr:hypothetical protein LOC_Os12g17380 [Oryza sativa Japonica Group]
MKVRGYNSDSSRKGGQRIHPRRSSCRRRGEEEDVGKATVTGWAVVMWVQEGRLRRGCGTCSSPLQFGELEDGRSASMTGQDPPTTMRSPIYRALKELYLIDAVGWRRCSSWRWRQHSRGVGHKWKRRYGSNCND